MLGLELSLARIGHLNEAAIEIEREPVEMIGDLHEVARTALLRRDPGGQLAGAKGRITGAEGAR